VGCSLPTREVLAFASAHASARDAVHAALDIPALESRLAAEAPPGSSPVLAVQSAAPDRARFLLRPDLGRRLSLASAAALDAHAAQAAPAPQSCDLLLVLADGLSALAVERQGPPLVAALRAGAPKGWRLGPLVLASQARVALGDEIGARLGAAVVAVLIGERPGLSSPDSLGIYLTWSPRVGRSDAERNCLSNVRPEGLRIDEAARKLWWLVQAAQQIGRTGVDLKDESSAKVQLNAPD
jgi:ethanolamine ammonia-lyase small subunit